MFRVATEVSQLDVINLATQRQKYIDQAQSLNLNITKHAKAKDIIQLSVEAYRGNLKTLYYQYNVNASQELTRQLLMCESCAA